MTAGVHLILGAVRVEWCEECLASHAKANLYIDDDLTASPAGEWNEGHAE